MLDGEVTDVVEAHSLSLNPQHIHIYSASWGPEDDGKSLDGPAKLAKEAFLQGITQVSLGKAADRGSIIASLYRLEPRLQVFHTDFLSLVIMSIFRNNTV